MRGEKGSEGRLVGKPPLGTGACGFDSHSSDWLGSPP